LIVSAGHREESKVATSGRQETGQSETGKDGSSEPIDLSLLHLDESMSQNRKLQSIERRRFEGTDPRLFQMREEQTEMTRRDHRSGRSFGRKCKICCAQLAN